MAPILLTSFSNLSLAFSAEACTSSCFPLHSSSSLNNALVSVSSSPSTSPSPFPMPGSGSRIRIKDQDQGSQSRIKSPSTSPSPFPMPGSQGTDLEFRSHLNAAELLPSLHARLPTSCLQSSVCFALCQKFQLRVVQQLAGRHCPPTHGLASRTMMTQSARDLVCVNETQRAHTFPVFVWKQQ